MFGRVRMAIGRMLADPGVDKAIGQGGDEMESGIMPRCIDYDKMFKLSSLGLTADQRAIGAMYIFATEVDSPNYKNLENALRNYTAALRVRPPFTDIDKHFVMQNGLRCWKP